MILGDGSTGGITDRRSMAGTAPTDFQFTKTLDAGPVHCSVWLCLPRPPVGLFEFPLL
jgi:hypothetical protein